MTQSLAAGDVALLRDPVAQELLRSTNMARLAYTSNDGTPRVVPIWFHWTGEVVSMGTPAAAPKVKALRVDPRVAITIDGGAFPYRALLIRGEAQVEVEPDITAEYAAAAMRYLGEEAGSAWLDQARALATPMARVAVRPDWVAILDFENRFPSALASRMRAAAGA